MLNIFKSVKLELKHGGGRGGKCNFALVETLPLKIVLSWGLELRLKIWQGVAAGLWTSPLLLMKGFV